MLYEIDINYGQESEKKDIMQLQKYFGNELTKWPKIVTNFFYHIFFFYYFILILLFFDMKKN